MDINDIKNEMAEFKSAAQTNITHQAVITFACSKETIRVLFWIPNHTTRRILVQLKEGKNTKYAINTSVVEARELYHILRDTYKMRVASERVLNKLNKELFLRKEDVIKFL